MIKLLVKEKVKYSLDLITKEQEPKKNVKHLLVKYVLLVQLYYLVEIMLETLLNTVSGVVNQKKNVLLVDTKYLIQ